MPYCTMTFYCFTNFNDTCHWHPEVKVSGCQRVTDGHISKGNAASEGKSEFAAKVKMGTGEFAE